MDVGYCHRRRTSVHLSVDCVLGTPVSCTKTVKPITNRELAGDADSSEPS